MKSVPTSATVLCLIFTTLGNGILAGRPKRSPARCAALRLQLADRIRANRTLTHPSRQSIDRRGPLRQFSQQPLQHSAPPVGLLG